jgi:hypothetical protein
MSYALPKFRVASASNPLSLKSGTTEDIVAKAGDGMEFGRWRVRSIMQRLPCCRTGGSSTGLSATDA